MRRVFGIHESRESDSQLVKVKPVPGAGTKRGPWKTIQDIQMEVSCLKSGHGSKKKPGTPVKGTREAGMPWVNPHCVPSFCCLPQRVPQCAPCHPLDTGRQCSLATKKAADQIPLQGRSDFPIPLRGSFTLWGKHHF